MTPTENRSSPLALARQRPVRAGPARSPLRLLTRFARALPLVLLSACGADDEKPPPPEPVSNDPTFTNITKRVITAGKCAGPQCHSVPLLSGFALGSKTTLYNTLVGVPAAGPECDTSGLMRVVPGDPDQSLLYLKIYGALPDGGLLCGDPMPVNSRLTDEEIDLLRRWILAGAPND